jgi:uncharacterized protein
MRFIKPALAILALALSMPAAAQFSDSYNFLKAVKESDGKEAEKFINEIGFDINTKDDGTGQTALHIVTQRKDLDWLSYLLGKGARPNLTDKKGVTPLMLASQLNWTDGASLLLKRKADIDATNKSGETALIRAVQLRHAEMVRLLMKSGANPDKQDNVAGYSARDYAAQDGRGNAILAIIESGGKGDEAKEGEGKKGDLDFSGIEDK